MIFVKKIFLYSIFVFMLSSCQSVKDNLSLKKKESVDEFLIEKKNPLVVPPEFSKLPVPKSEDENTENSVDKEEDLDLSKVLTETETIEPTNSSNELEKSISNILNKK